jgi:hypothetical protein
VRNSVQSTDLRLHKLQLRTPCVGRRSPPPCVTFHDEVVGGRATIFLQECCAKKQADRSKWLNLRRNFSPMPLFNGLGWGENAYCRGRGIPTGYARIILCKTSGTLIATVLAGDLAGRRVSATPEQRTLPPLRMLAPNPRPGLVQPSPGRTGSSRRPGEDAVRLRSRPNRELNLACRATNIGVGHGRILSRRLGPRFSDACLGVGASACLRLWPVSPRR